MLKVKLLNPLATPPTIAHPGEDLAYDVYALRAQGQPLKEDGTPVVWNPPRPGLPIRLDMNGKLVIPIRIEAGRPLIVETGLALHYVGEEGKKYGLLMMDRSSLAAKGIFITGGVVDAGYRGELKVVLNLTAGSYADLWPGDRIAQLIPIPVLADGVEVVADLEESERKEAGFGSSGS